MKVERFAVDKSTPIKKVMALMDTEALNEVVVYDGDRKIATLSQSKINDIILSSNVYAPIGECLR